MVEESSLKRGERDECGAINVMEKENLKRLELLFFLLHLGAKCICDLWA